MRLLFLACAFAATMVLLAMPEVALAASQTVTAFIDPVRPFIIEIVSLVIAGLLAFATRKFTAWTGIEIEARHREALQSALENGARLVIDALGKKGDGEVTAGTLSAGVDYVVKSVPDAVGHFGLDRKRIGDLIRPKLIPKE